jgi:hypothetical protein
MSLFILFLGEILVKDDGVHQLVWAVLQTGTNSRKSPPMNHPIPRPADFLKLTGQLEEFYQPLESQETARYEGKPGY